MGSAARGILSNLAGRFNRPQTKPNQTQSNKTKLNMNTTNTNNPEFDYCEWLTTKPTKEEFLTVWQQFTATEKAAILADFQQWLENNR
jgi:hypothetical protein